MANNYLLFSESIDHLSDAEEAGLDRLLEAIAVFDGVEYVLDDLGDAEVETEDGTILLVEDADFAGCRAYRDFADYEYDPMSYDRGFLCEFAGKPTSENGRHLWLYTEEGGDPSRLGHFVMKFLQEFRPFDCWSGSYAFTCSRPRVGEFGGGALFVTAKEVKWETSYSFIEREKALFKTQRLNKKQDTDAKADDHPQGE